MSTHMCVRVCVCVCTYGCSAVTRVSKSGNPPSSGERLRSPSRGGGSRERHRVLAHPTRRHNTPHQSIPSNLARCPELISERPPLLWPRRRDLKLLPQAILLHRRLDCVRQRVRSAAVLHTEARRQARSFGLRGGRKLPGRRVAAGPALAAAAAAAAAVPPRDRACGDAQRLRRLQATACIG